MQHFDFEKVHEYFCRIYENQRIDERPFGPLLAKIIVEDDLFFIVGVLGAAAILPYFLSEDGKERLQELIAGLLQNQDENFCVVQLQEGHMKTAKDGVIVMPDELVSSDASHQNCIILSIHHKTGVRFGCLPIGPGRVARYAPLLEAGQVKIENSPLH